MKVKDTTSYVVLLDIVGFSEGGSEEQAECVNDFLKLLETNLSILGGQKFNIFPIGDGSILCIYEETPSPTATTSELPLTFARAMLKTNKDNNFDLRISINYSKIERIISVKHLKIDTSHIQIGNGINVAERIIHFCEPNEIIVSEDYWDVLFQLKIPIRSQFHSHKKVFVKHMKDLKIFSYLPAEDEKSFIYDLRNEGRQHFRKYAYFPPVKGPIIQRIKNIGLDNDLQQMCAYAYDTLTSINMNKMFISWGGIYETLKKIPTEQEKEILVISREDLKGDFWSTDGAENYLRHLERLSGQFKHSRIFIYDPHLGSTTPDEIIERLARLHQRGTLKKIDREYIPANALLKYSFGITIFPNLKCAIAPLPVPLSYDEYVNNLRFTEVENMSLRYGNRNFENTIFKALVIINEDIINDLTSDFNSLRKHPMIEEI